jgi:hypothetical protein
MKVSELPEDADLGFVKMRLPEDALKAFKGYGGGEPEMYYCGQVMGWGHMMSPDRPGGDRKLYPIPAEVDPKSLLEWEVVE